MEYREREIVGAIYNHINNGDDDAAPMRLKITGTGAGTKYLNISPEEARIIGGVLGACDAFGAWPGRD